MSKIFSYVVANLANDFMMRFPPDFDFATLLNNIGEDSGVCIHKNERSVGGAATYKLQGQWCAMEQAYRLLSSAMAEHGVRPKNDDVNTSPSPQDHKATDHRFISKKSKQNSVKGRHRKENLAKPLTASYISNGKLNTVECENKANYLHENFVHNTEIDDFSAAMDSISDESQKKRNAPQSSRLHSDEEVMFENTHEVPEKKVCPKKPAKKQQRRGRLCKSISKPFAQVNHKYSFLSKYHDQSYPSLKRTVHKRKAVPPVTVDSCDQVVRKKHGRPKEHKQGQKDFACLECEFVAYSRYKLKDHIQRRHKGNPVSCDLCGKIFHNQIYMMRHRSSHTGPQHCCDICGKMFKIQRAMINHRKTHEDGYTRPHFPCKLCAKTFCSQYIVNCHVKSVHLGQKKSYLCSYCGKKFTTKNSLQEHVNAHSGIKPHVCEICGKGFSYDSALRDHKFTHDDVKQFKCDICNKSYCQRSGLKMHMRIHKDTKQFQCQECGREFTQKQALQRHERVHKGVKPFTCKLCSRSFTDASIIRRHLTLVHKTHKDAKTWREDIICTIKPDPQYHVSYVGLKEADLEPNMPHAEKGQVEAKTLLQSRARSGRQACRNLVQHETLKDSDSHFGVPLQSLSAVSESSHKACERTGLSTVSRTQPVIVNLDCIATNTLTQEVSSSLQSTFHNSGYLPQPSDSESAQVPPEQTDSSFASISAIPSQHTSASAVLSHHIPGLAVSKERLFDASAPCSNIEEVNEASSMYTSSSYDAVVHPAFPPGPFIQSNTLHEQQHRALTGGSQQSQDRARESTAMTITNITTSKAPAMSIASPQPSPSLYYYSQLASQFGVSFPDYPYISTTAFTGVGLGPVSPGLDHSSPVQPRPLAHGQANLDLSQGHGVSNVQDHYGGSQSLMLSSPVLESSQSNALLDGGTSATNMSSVLPNPLLSQKSGDK